MSVQPLVTSAFPWASALQKIDIHIIGEISLCNSKSALLASHQCTSGPGLVLSIGLPVSWLP